MFIFLQYIHYNKISTMEFRKSCIALCTLLLAMTVQAQAQKWFNNVKLSGFALLQYQYSGQANAKANSFNVRMGRLSLDGRFMKDWYWKTQIQFNGNTATLGASPRVVDLFAEWQRYECFRVKFGQFKNPFSFENPIHPITQGFQGYSQVVSKLVGFSDRSGMQASNGRDIGLQVQGDFLKNAAGRNLLHYQVGVFNGQGINVKDVDQQKNIIGAIWVMPIEGMRIGVSGWRGSYARKGTWTDEAGVKQSGVRSLPQRRYAFSVDYVKDDWTVRSEYIHSTGFGFAKPLENTKNANATDCNLSTLGDKAQGVYALVIAPIIKEKLHAKVRYDMYQPSKGAERQRTQYDAGLDYAFNKNILVSGIYSYVHDRSLEKPNYSMIDVQLQFKF